MTDEHETQTMPIKDGPWTRAYFATCSCTWTGPERKRHGEAVHDCADHLRVLAPRPKE